MKKNTSWYSILVALFIIWFLLILTAWIFRLVLNELHDNRGRWDYLKAQYAAESWIELALLKIKTLWYGVVDEVSLDINERAVILGEYPTDKSKFKGSKESLLGYKIDTKTLTYTGEIEAGWHSIIPLFYVDKNGSQFDTKSITLKKTSIDPVWNIVWNQFWLSWEWEFSSSTLGNYKFTNANGFGFDKKSVQDFLDTSTSNYLILFNPSPDTPLTYNLTAEDNNFFTRPIGDIYASWKIGSYKQNIKVTLDNTAYLNILKYSLFSN